MRRGRPWLAGATGFLLLVAGVLVFAGADDADAGWTTYSGSYEPLESAYSSELSLTFDDWWVVWTPEHARGAALVVLGLLVLTGLGGWLLGRRPAGPGRPPSA